MPLLKSKKNYQALLGIINSLSKFCPIMTEVCEPIRWLTSVRTECMWNAENQELYEKAKAIIKRCMHEVLVWNKTSVLGDQHIQGRVGSRGTAEIRYNELSSRWSTPQQYPNCILQQNLVKYGKKIEQHWKRSIRNTEWTRGMLPLLLCQRGKFHHRLQATNIDLQEGHSQPIADTSMCTT